MRRSKSHGTTEKLYGKPSAKCMDDIQVATYNAGPLAARAKQVLDCLSKGVIDVACLQEVRIAKVDRAILT